MPPAEARVGAGHRAAKSLAAVPGLTLALGRHSGPVPDPLGADRAGRARGASGSGWAGRLEGQVRARVKATSQALRAGITAVAVRASPGSS